jgi:hypothetical protein
VLAGDRQLDVTVVEQCAAQQPQLDAKIWRPSEFLIVTSQRLAALKISSFFALLICLRAAAKALVDRRPTTRAACREVASRTRSKQRRDLFSPMRSKSSAPRSRPEEAESLWF